MTDQTHEFIEALFGQKHERAAVQVWHRDQPPLTWTLSNLDTIERKALEGADKHDVYIACGLAPQAMERPSRTRLKKEDVAGIPGVWADIDVNGGPEDKTNAAPDMQAAIELAHELLEPTLLVHSGYGLQAWWLLEEPWMFPDRNEQAQAKRVVAGFQGALRAAARRHGYGLDHTHDLSRVLRIPGTFNHKGQVPVEVQILEHGGKRYSIEELAEIGQGYANAIDKANDELTAMSTGDLVLEIRRGVDLDPRVRELVREDPDFAARWQKKAPRGKQWSASDFEMSMVNWLVRAGLEPQQVCDALVAWRVMHGEDNPAKMRVDKMARTIGKAIFDCKIEEDELSRVEGIEEALEELGRLGANGHHVNEAKVMGHLNQVVGGGDVEVARLRQYSRDHTKARFVIELSDGREITLGDVNGLTNQGRFRNAVVCATQHYPPVVKPAKWDKIVSALFKAAHVIDEAEDSSTGQMRGWVEDYLATAGSTDRDGACQSKASFIEGEHVFISLSHFMQWLRRSRGERVEQPDVAAVLRALGFERKVVNYRKLDGSRTTASMFRGPSYGLTSPEAEAEDDESAHTL